MQLEHASFGQHYEVVSGKDEVGNAALDHDFSDKVAVGGPDVQPVAAAAVNVPVEVCSNTVRNSCGTQFYLTDTICSLVGLYAVSTTVG